MIAGDEVVVTKSGKKTYGIGRFFSSLYGKAIPSISFLALSLISVNNRSSHPLMMEQIVKEDLPVEKPTVTKKSCPKKAKRGRPTGSSNKSKKDVELSAYLQFVQATLKSLLQIVGTDLSLVYFVFDGAFGNNASLQMIRQCDLHIISNVTQ